MIRFAFLLSLFLFHPSARAMSDDLRRIVGNIAVSAALGHNPVVITDLDETLIDTTSRRYQALRQTVVELCGRARNGDCGKAAGLNISDFLALPNRYDQKELLTEVGISPQMQAKLLNGMIEKYLSGNGLELDQPLRGAAQFVTELREAGAKIFFVSSRSDELQRAGTLASLEDMGMIRGEEENEVLLKPKGMRSIDFKRSILANLKSWAEANASNVDLVMENEPENMNSMTDQFPAAESIFVDGAFLKPEPLRGHPLHVENFR